MKFEPGSLADITGKCHTCTPVIYPIAHVFADVDWCCAALVIHLKRRTPTISDEGSLTNHTIKQNYCLTYRTQM